MQVIGLETDTHYVLILEKMIMVNSCIGYGIASVSEPIKEISIRLVSFLTWTRSFLIIIFQTAGFLVVRITSVTSWSSSIVFVNIKTLPEFLLADVMWRYLLLQPLII